MTCGSPFDCIDADADIVRKIDALIANSFMFDSAALHQRQVSGNIRPLRKTCVLYFLTSPSGSPYSFLNEVQLVNPNEVQRVRGANRIYFIQSFTHQRKPISTLERSILKPDRRDWRRNNKRFSIWRMIKSIFPSQPLLCPLSSLPSRHRFKWQWKSVCVWPQGPRCECGFFSGGTSIQAQTGRQTAPSISCDCGARA